MTRSHFEELLITAIYVIIDESALSIQIFKFEYSLTTGLASTFFRRVGVMGRLRDLRESKKAVILTYLKCGKTQSEIARLCSVSQQSVSRISRTFTMNNLSSRRKQRCGRKLLLSDRDRRLLLKRVKKDRKITSTELRNDLEATGIKIGRSTVRRYLVKLGYRAHRPRCKPKLTPAMKSKRLQWCYEHQHLTVEDWLNVGFSDENSFQILTDKAQYVRRLPTEEFHPDWIKQTVKHPTSVMVWSVVSGKGTGRLHVIEGKLNAEKYIDILKNRLVPQVNDWYRESNVSDFTFMQDSGPCHTAKSAMKFLQKDLKMKVLKWPAGNSPDLNPLENLWEMLKKKIASDNPLTKTQLIASLIRHWHRDRDIQDLVIPLISSMPRRIQAVIQAKGGTTKY